MAAHADAVTVAQQLHAFASIGGPAETPAYQDELARQHVLCMGCGDSSIYGEIKRNAPYQWANLPTADTSLYETIDYVVAKLNGKDAVWAGDPSMHTHERKFIVVNETLGAAFAGLAELTAAADQEAEGGPRQHGVADRPAVHAQPDHAAHPGRHPGREAEGLGCHQRHLRRRPDHADLPDQGVRQHRVLPRVDHHRDRAHRHLDPGALLRPEEWAHAFGVTSLAVPVPVDAGDADRLYHWWYGAGTSPASPAAPAIIPPILQFFTGVQLAGPDLTP